MAYGVQSRPIDKTETKLAAKNQTVMSISFIMNILMLIVAY